MLYSASVAYNGKNLVTISKMMGHSQTTSTVHYLRDVMQDNNLGKNIQKSRLIRLGIQRCSSR